MALGMAIVGTGEVAPQYALALENRPEVQLIGAQSRTLARTAEFAERFGGRIYDSLDDLLADSDVELVVNLTTQQAHAAITERCLEAGRHVYSEKPLALSPLEAHRLVALADRRGLRLSSAPSTFLSPPQQTALRLVRSGRLGAIRAVYAEANRGRIETEHPRPGPFFDVGPAIDVGVYPVTLLTAAFGPVRAVQALGRHLLRGRQTMAGKPFESVAPDLIIALLEFQGGTVARLTASFYVGHSSRQRGLEFHGDAGTLILDNWFTGDARLEFAADGGSVELIEPDDEPFPGVDYGLGVVELARSIAEGRSQQAAGSHAAHVIEVLEAVMLSARDGREVEVRSGITGTTDTGQP